ncbi:chlorophyllase- chloroplastic [Brachionus plicatilis]|uniref:Chlorophyllase-chloroplastic n=1 Tax=Brachionus plicatilis TaxID=10195 RepID=A0A3M7QNH8_BRAPC|nr:chlorophyllase- chloroplastic [Brachionus plicatilis]
MITALLALAFASLVHAQNESISWNFGSFIRPKNHSVEFDIRFVSPTTPGQYPVIFFLTGLDGLAPGFAYVDFITKLSIETKTIIVSFDSLRFPSIPNKEEKMFLTSLEWTLENLPAFFNNKKTPEQIKDKVFPSVEDASLMAHSASGHTVVSYLNETCGKMKALILLDPVDGYDPFGFLKIYITNPPQQLPFVMPTLLIRTGLDNVPANPLFPACAPDKVSNKRFYDSLPGPSWFLNFTQYGHAGILDDYLRKVASLICKVCENDCEFELYRKSVVTAIGLFYKGINFKSEKFLEALENPEKSGFFDPKIQIKSVSKSNGYNVLNTGPFCKHQ